MNMSVAGELPSSVGAWSSLETLLLRGNGLYGDLPSFDGLANVQRIDLSLNLFQGALHASLLRLPSLTTLCAVHSLVLAMRVCVAESTAIDSDLSANRLTGALPTTVSAPQLTHLDLHENSLSGPLPPTLLANASKLYYLSRARVLCCCCAVADVCSSAPET